MKISSSIAAALLFSSISVAMLAFQRRGFEDDDEAPALAADAHQKAEWTFARYHFRSDGQSIPGLSRISNLGGGLSKGRPAIQAGREAA